MGWNPWDMVNDLAVARGLRGADADSDSRYLRGRVAAVLWIPGLGIALAVGGWNNSVWLGLGVMAITVVVMALVAWGPRRVVSFVTRRFAKQA